MLPTYPATLRAGTLDWGAGGPPALPSDPVPVHVTLLTPQVATPRGPAMAAALEALAAAGGPAGFGDPVGWQRETRADQPSQAATSTATNPNTSSGTAAPANHAIPHPAGVVP